MSSSQRGVRKISIIYRSPQQRREWPSAIEVFTTGKIRVTSPAGAARGIEHLECRVRVPFAVTEHNCSLPLARVRTHWVVADLKRHLEVSNLENKEGIRIQDHR